MYPDLKHIIEFSDNEVTAMLAVLQDGQLKTRLQVIQERNRKKVDEEPDEALRQALGPQAGDVVDAIKRLRDSGWELSRKDKDARDQ